MSRALARLREATGDPLLVRAGRGLVPTPRALELRGRVGQLVAGRESGAAPGREARPRACWSARSRCGPARASSRPSGRSSSPASARGARRAAALHAEAGQGQRAAARRHRRSGNRRRRRRRWGRKCEGAGAVPRPLHRRGAQRPSARARARSRRPAMRPAGTSASPGAGWTRDRSTRPCSRSGLAREVVTIVGGFADRAGSRPHLRPDRERARAAHRQSARRHCTALRCRFRRGKLPSRCSGIRGSMPIRRIAGCAAACGTLRRAKWSWTRITRRCHHLFPLCPSEFTLETAIIFSSLPDPCIPAMPCSVEGAF